MAIMNINDVFYTSLETIDVFETSADGGNYLFTLDELQDATIAHDFETEDITGKRGRLLSTIKRNKSCTVSGNNGLVSIGLLQAQLDADISTNTSQTIMYTDYLTMRPDASAGAGLSSAATSWIPVGGSLTSQTPISAVYVKDDNGMIAKALSVSSSQITSSDTGKFYYDTSSKKIIAVSSDLGNGGVANIVVNYNRVVTGSSITNLSDKYSRKVSMYVNGFAEDKCAKVYRVQWYFPIVDLNGTFDITLGDTQTVHAFEARAISGNACAGDAVSGMFYTYTIWGEDSSDAAISVSIRAFKDSSNNVILGWDVDDPDATLALTQDGTAVTISNDEKATEAKVISGLSAGTYTFALTATNNGRSGSGSVSVTIS